MKSGNQQFQQTCEFVHHLLQTVVQTSESISFASTASFLPLRVSSSECSGKWTFEEHINKKFYFSHYLRPFQSTMCNSIWKMKCSCFLTSELEVDFQFPVNVGILSWYGLHMCFVCLLLFILFFCMLPCLISYTAVLHFQKIPFPYSYPSPLTLTFLLPPLPQWSLSHWRQW